MSPNGKALQPEYLEPSGIAEQVDTNWVAAKKVMFPATRRETASLRLQNASARRTALEPKAVAYCLGDHRRDELRTWLDVNQVIRAGL